MRLVKFFAKGVFGNAVTGLAMTSGNESDPPRRNEGPARPWGEPSSDRQQPQATGPDLRGRDPRGSDKRGFGARGRGALMSILFAVVLLALYGTQAYQDLSSPSAWAYWKDLYFSPSMSASVVPAAANGRKALAIEGQIGAAAASWFREKLDDAKLSPGDLVFLSSPGGRLDQALIMGEMIRSRGLTTVVGKVDAEGRPHPSYCASACVLVYAGGKIREAMPRSVYGVHQFSTDMSKGDPGRDLVAETQKTTGMILEYMTRMGVSPSILQQMSATKDMHWLNAKEAFDLKLVTDRYAGS